MMCVCVGVCRGRERERSVDREGAKCRWRSGEIEDGILCQSGGFEKKNVFLQ